MTDDITNWTELREFFGVDILRSYALSWLVDSGSLLVDLDLCLNPEHPYYEEPRPSEKACFRPAFLEFPEIVSVSGDDSDGTDTSLVAAIQPGKITGLRRSGEGRYEVNGDFGNVVIRSGRPLLKIKNLAG